MRTFTLLVAVVILCGMHERYTVNAQSTSGTASPAAEPFKILPAAVPAGSNDFSIRFEAGTNDLFSTSSARQPTLSFGTGITLVAGSFKVLSTSEAQARVNVSANSIGGVETRITFYSVDGKTAARQERATLGIVGPFKPAANEQIEMSVDEIRLIRVNVDEAQRAGAVSLKGVVSGIVNLTPPAGTVCIASNMPAVAVDDSSVTISNPAVDATKGSFSFVVNNAQSKSATVTVDNLMLDTSDFTSLGGALGNLSSGVSGGVFGVDTVLVVNAHTALETLEGEEIPEGSDTSSDTSSSTDTSAPSSTTPGTTLFNPPRFPPKRNDSSSGAPSTPSSPLNPASNPQMPPATGVDPNSPASNPGVVRPGEISPPIGKPPVGPTVVAPGATGKTGGDGTMAPVNGAPGSANEPDPRTSKPASLKSSRRLYFADKDFNRLPGIVLDDGKQNQQCARVWVVLEGVSDPTPFVDKITVSLRSGMNSRPIVLTETGPQTGVFHCDAAGIEVAAGNNKK